MWYYKPCNLSKLLSLHTAEKECCVEGTFPETGGWCPCLCGCPCRRWWLSLRWEGTYQSRWTWEEETEREQSVGWNILSPGYISLLVYLFLCVRMHLCDIHGGGLPSPILSQKGSNLALIKADAKSIHCWRRVTTEHLDQVLNTNTLHQVSWLRFKE